jgi:NTP pyrophosphatase (non-canonical NTP hydrolase)
MADAAAGGRGIDELLAVMRRLRDPERGCPWDVQQDFASIAPYAIEEAYEVADAIARADWRDLEAELGDLLLQVAYHARMAEEQGLFDFDRVARGIAAKMVARHPHVFGEARSPTPRPRTRSGRTRRPPSGPPRPSPGATRACSRTFPWRCPPSPARSSSRSGRRGPASTGARPARSSPSSARSWTRSRRAGRRAR